jgi:hypothetical protein
VCGDRPSITSYIDYEGFCTGVPRTAQAAQ